VENSEATWKKATKCNKSFILLFVFCFVGICKHNFFLIKVILFCLSFLKRECKHILIKYFRYILGFLKKPIPGNLDYDFKRSLKRKIFKTLKYFISFHLSIFTRKYEEMQYFLT
jgi:hypothetical protein